MSTLTKILIVLLSLFSIFLCGAVVTYVSTAKNYKAELETQRDENNVLVAENRSRADIFNEKVAQMRQLEKDLNDDLQVLQQKFDNKVVEWRTARRTSLDYQRKVNNLTGIFTSFEQTIANMEQSLTLTQAQLDKTREVSIQDRQYLNEIQARLGELLVHMQTLETDKRRLLEEKDDLEKQILAVDSGVSIETTGVVTPEIDFASRPADTRPGGLDLKGLITDVGDSLVTISLGADDGVSKGMLFYVCRGDDYICDIRITNVETDKAAGVPELVQPQMPPRINDNVSTKM